MYFIRKTIIFLTASLLPILLLSFGALFGMFQVLGSPSHVKSALDSSGIYDDAVASIIKQNAAQSGATTVETSGGAAAIEKAVSDSVSASYVKEQAERVLDGVYSWLGSDTAELQFSVDLAPIKPKLVENLAEQAKRRAQALPACTASTMPSPDTDAFSLTCLPTGVSTDQVAAQTEQQALSSELFKSANVTPQTLIGSGGEPIDKKLEPFKRSYRIAKQSMYIVGMASLAGIVAIILLSRPWRAGIKRTSYIFITSGSIGIIAAFVGKIISGGLIGSLLRQEGNTPETGKTIIAVQSLVTDVCNWWLLLGIASVLLAITGLVYVKLWARAHITTGHVPDERKRQGIPLKPDNPGDQGSL